MTLGCVKSAQHRVLSRPKALEDVLLSGLAGGGGCLYDAVRCCYWVVLEETAWRWKDDMMNVSVAAHGDPDQQTLASGAAQTSGPLMESCKKDRRL